MTVQKFTDLNTWKEGHKLVLLIYRQTSTFPKAETYSLTDQMRRAVVSITSNIAEGFGRHGTKEKIQFLYLALGSCYELKNQLIIARDLDYLPTSNFHLIEEKLEIVAKLINGSIRAIKSVNY